MSSGIHVRCPVSDNALFIVDEDERSVGLYRSLAYRHLISILDITTMLTLAVYGPDVSPEAEITDRIRDAECDGHLLKLALPLDEAIEIWLRAREGLQWLAANCPDEERRAKIVAFLAAKEAGMAALIAKAKGRSA